MPPGPLPTRDRSPGPGGMRKVALVTRGASRLGQALAVGLAESGFDVAVEVVEAPGAAARLTAEVRRRGRRILLLDRTGAHPEPEEHLLRPIEEHFGRLDALIVVPAPPPLDGDDPVEAMLEEPFRLARAAARLLKEARGSVVHCLDDGEAEQAAPLRALTRALARILAPWIRVNAVVSAAPGDGPGPHPPAPVGETVRAVLYVLASPHLSGEVVRADPVD